MRTVADAAIFLLLLVLVVGGLREAGWLGEASGRFTVVDGDSLRSKDAEYRLHGIDAPELRQSCGSATGASYSCGRAARDALSRLVSGRDLDCHVSDTDHYGRLVAQCSAGGTDINAEMVSSGWAIAYRRHSGAYAAAEADARMARRGLWQGTFEEPERWRETARGKVVKGGIAAIGDLPPD